MTKTLTRVLILLLAACLALPLGAPAASEQAPLVVASTTALTGEFMAGLFGNNTADVDVRILLHDYPTVVWELDQQAAVNEAAVQRMDQSQDEQGHTVYTFTIKEGLRYSDGSAITAADYAFSVLLQASPLIRQIGGMNAGWEHLAGARAYSEGSSPVLSGLRLLDDRRFSLAIDQGYLPYYYDLSYAVVQPYPIAGIAPDCQVVDEGDGARVSGGFTAELLEKTLLDPETGYLSHPGVTSGAYRLLRYDAEQQAADFELNPYYGGSREGRLPAIARLRYQGIRNEEVAEALGSGQVHLVNKLSAADTIDQVEALTGSSVRTTAYPRTGFAYLAFSAERPLAASLTFRQAIARMVDREGLIQRFLKGKGQPVYAYYGLGQWMAQAARQRLKALDLQPYDLDAAMALLEQDGWTLDADGAPFRPGSDGLRHRAGAAGLEPLIVRAAIAPFNQAGQLVMAGLADSLAALGGELSLTTLPLAYLLRQYYRQDARDYDLLFLASNFGYVFDPYYNVHTGDAYQGTLNTSGLRDEELMALAKTLRETAPGDREGYLRHWLAFQTRWSQLQPMVPLYSNDYVDAYSPRLSGYRPAAFHSWADAILYASFR